MIDESLLKSNVLGRDGFTWWIGRVAHPDFWKKENEISDANGEFGQSCLLYTSPSPRDDT